MSQSDEKFLNTARNIEKALSFINAKKEPSSDIERAKYHYDCINLYTERKKRLVLDVLALFALPLSVLFTCIYTITHMNISTGQIDCVIYSGGENTNLPNVDAILPQSLKNRYSKIENIDIHGRRALFATGLVSKDIIRTLVKCIVKYPFLTYFNFSVFMHLCTINRIIRKYNPKTILSIAGENDFSTSLLTEFCEENNTKYTCLMHGEYFLEANHAFVRFSEIYVWDEYYVKQFDKLHAKTGKYHIYIPNRFNMHLKLQEPTYFIGYYLQEFSERQLLAIRDTLKIFTKLGFKCKIRPHKRASDMETVNRIFKDENGIDIEMFSISIEESYCNVKYIVSMYSTVLSEAYYNNLHPVIDDISDPYLYRSLKEIMNINLNRIDKRLSSIVDDVKNRKNDD